MSEKREKLHHHHSFIINLFKIPQTCKLTIKQNESKKKKLSLAFTWTLAIYIFF